MRYINQHTFQLLIGSELQWHSHLADLSLGLSVLEPHGPMCGPDKDFNAQAQA